MIKIIKEHWEDPDGGKNSFQKTIDSTLYQKVEGGFKSLSLLLKLLIFFQKFLMSLRVLQLNCTSQKMG